MLKIINENCWFSEAKIAFKYIDTNKSGSINCDEFCRFVGKR